MVERTVGALAAARKIAAHVKRANVVDMSAANENAERDLKAAESAANLGRRGVAFHHWQDAAIFIERPHVVMKCIVNSQRGRKQDSCAFILAHKS